MCNGVSQTAPCGPTYLPTPQPTENPTIVPVPVPTYVPTGAPAPSPSAVPIGKPSYTPTARPERTAEPAAFFEADVRTDDHTSPCSSVEPTRSGAPLNIVQSCVPALPTPPAPPLTTRPPALPAVTRQSWHDPTPRRRPRSQQRCAQNNTKHRVHQPATRHNHAPPRRRGRSPQNARQGQADRVKAGGAPRTSVAETDAQRLGLEVEPTSRARRRRKAGRAAPRAPAGARKSAVVAASS